MPWHVKKNRGEQHADESWAAAGRAELAQHYEALRAAALGQQPGAPRAPQGLALVVQRGLPAWMVVWVRCVPAATTDLRPSAAAPTQLAPGSAGEMTRLLATMILQRQGRRP